MLTDAEMQPLKDLEKVELSGQSLTPDQRDELRNLRIRFLEVLLDGDGAAYAAQQFDYPSDGFAL